jgi:hypothetical protein
MPPDTYLKLSTSGNILHVQKGAHPPSDQSAPVAIYVRGYASQESPRADAQKAQFGNAPKQGGGALATYTWFRDGLLHMPTIAFDPRDQRKNFSCGQDITGLEEICPPNAFSNPLLLCGTSQGARMLLGWLAHRQKANTLPPIKAAVVESPMVSLSDLCDHWAHQNVDYGLQGIASYLMFKVLSRWFPSFDPKKDNLLEQLAKCSFPFPLLIAHLKDDPLVSDISMLELVSTLRAHRNDVYLCVMRNTEDTEHPVTHSRLSRALPLQTAAHALYKKYGLPYNTKLAHQGKSVLGRAKKNAEDKKSALWWHVEKIE